MQRKTGQKVKKRDCLNFRKMRMNLFPDQKFSLGTLFFFRYITACEFCVGNEAIPDTLLAFCWYFIRLFCFLSRPATRSSNIQVKWYTMHSSRQKVIPRNNNENLKMHITSHLESHCPLYNLYNLSLLYEDKLAQKENKIIPYT